MSGKQFDATIEDLQRRVGVCTHDSQCKAITHYSDCRSMPSTKSLRQLLRQVDDLFVRVPACLNETYNYSLGRMPSGWTFTVTNSWHKWLDAGLEHEFRLFKTPEQAVEAFLAYVIANKINIAELTE